MASHLHPAGPSLVGSARPGVRRAELIDLVGLVAKPLPLSVLLDEVPPRIARVAGADIASLYLLEPDGALVMRGTAGFPLGVRGRVRLERGEGITGRAVAKGRPVTAKHAPDATGYRAFPELDEGRFPVFLAVPILGAKGPLGALVVQRAADHRFRPREIDLVTALTAPLALALQRSEQPEIVTRRAGGGTKRVTLTGTTLVAGRALGAVAPLRRPATSPRTPATPHDRKLLLAAFDEAKREVEALLGRAFVKGLAEEASFLTSYLLIASDGRLRELALDEVDRGHGVARALSAVARTATRAAHESGPNAPPLLRERARDIEDMCDALLMMAMPDQRAAVPTGAVLVGDGLGLFDLLVTRRARPAAVALSERALGPKGSATNTPTNDGSLAKRTRVLAELLGLPTVAGVRNLFEWAASGDLALVDADHGLVVVNPSRDEIAAVRAARKKPAPPEDD